MARPDDTAPGYFLGDFAGDVPKPFALKHARTPPPKPPARRVRAELRARRRPVVERGQHAATTADAGEQ